MIKRPVPQRRVAQVTGGKGRDLSDYLPKMEAVEIEVTAAEIRTMFSLPLTLVPATPGVAHVIQFVHFHREAGTAYANLGPAGNFQLLINNFQWYNVVAAGQLFDGAGPYTSLLDGRSYATTGLGWATPSVVVQAADNVNQAIIMKFSGADVTGGSGRIFVTIFYRDFRNAPLGN